MSYYGHGAGLEHFNIKGPKVVKERCSSYDARFSCEKLLTRSLKEIHGKNYWLTPDKATGQEFMLDFGTEKTFNLVQLVNTHNGFSRDRSAKEFKVYLR